MTENSLDIFDVVQYSFDQPRIREQGEHELTLGFMNEKSNIGQDIKIRIGFRDPTDVVLDLLPKEILVQATAGGAACEVEIHNNLLRGNNLTF